MGGTRQGEHMPVCPSVGRPARMPSIIVKTKEEHKLGLEM
jgi:hypothetical protein